MKRLIRYTDKYRNDNGKFSNCSTDYEVLPFLVPDEAGNKELRDLTKQLGFSTRSQVKKPESSRWNSIKITHCLKIGTKTIKNYPDTEERNEYLGFITIPRSEVLEPIEDLSGKVTADQLDEIINNQELGIYNTAEIDDQSAMVVESWDAFHGFPLLGYGSFEDLLKDQEIEEYYFDDSVSSCSNCGAWFHNDNGYTYNYRIIDCELLGLDCGCAHEAMKDNLDSFVDNPDSCIETEVVSDLEDEGTLEKLETFIGGMVDGRGGFINGESVREGQPKEVLKEFQEKFPDDSFVFVREDSGQFQTYFSIYKLLKVEA